MADIMYLDLPEKIKNLFRYLSFTSQEIAYLFIGPKNSNDWFVMSFYNNQNIVDTHKQEVVIKMTVAPPVIANKIFKYTKEPVTHIAILSTREKNG